MAAMSVAGRNAVMHAGMRTICWQLCVRSQECACCVQSREESAAAVFGALDRASENKLSRLDFMELCTVLKVQSHDEERNTWLRVHHPKLYYSLAFQRITSLVLHPWFQAGAIPLTRR